MKRAIEATISNWRQTGESVSVPQYAVDVMVSWQERTGDVLSQHHHNETVYFPNVLAQMPAAWIKAELLDLMLRALKAKLSLEV